MTEFDFVRMTHFLVCLIFGIELYRLMNGK